MTTKTRPPSGAAVLRTVSLTPVSTTQERLQRIAALGQRINGYVQFICEVGNLNGTSVEAKEKVVVAFYEQMVAVERQLGRIHDDFQLE